MNGSNSAVAVEKSYFEQSFENVLGQVTHVPYNPEWKHGDYFNGACAVELAPGQIQASTVEGRDARRLLMIGTRAGTIVIFERYTPDNGSAFVLVSNACMELRNTVIPSGSLEVDRFCQLVTVHNPADNIGSRLETLFKMTAPSKRIS